MRAGGALGPLLRPGALPGQQRPCTLGGLAGVNPGLHGRQHLSEVLWGWSGRARSTAGGGAVLSFPVAARASRRAGYSASTSRRELTAHFWSRKSSPVPLVGMYLFPASLRTFQLSRERHWCFDGRRRQPGRLIVTYLPARDHRPSRFCLQCLSSVMFFFLGFLLGIFVWLL